MIKSLSWEDNMLISLLILALCASSALTVRVNVVYGTSAGSRPCDRECFDHIRRWLQERDCVIGFEVDNARAVFEVRLNDGSIQYTPISGTCFGYQLCNKCGRYGQCTVSYNNPVCSCQDGREGDSCATPGARVRAEDRTLIIVIAVLVGVVALIIVVGVCIHCCVRNRSRHQHYISESEAKPRNVTVITSGYNGPQQAMPRQAMPMGADYGPLKSYAPPENDGGCTRHIHETNFHPHSHSHPPYSHYPCPPPVNSCHTHAPCPPPPCEPNSEIKIVEVDDNGNPMPQNGLTLKSHRQPPVGLQPSHGLAYTRDTPVYYYRRY